MPLMLPILLERVQSQAGQKFSGESHALAVRVQFSWPDHQALPPTEMFIEKLK